MLIELAELDDDIVAEQWTDSLNLPNYNPSSASTGPAQPAKPMPASATEEDELK